MLPFAYERAADAAAAVGSAGRAPPGAGTPSTMAPAQFLAGGTTIVDLMKLGAMQPETLIDINDLQASYGYVQVSPSGLRLGALARMAQVAGDPGIRREYPVIAQSLQLAASAQLRNMASLGGNVLQRTRCPYFRETSWQACNKRVPGSGCAALDGVNRKHAVLGVGEGCIASYPGDFAQALIALDGSVELLGPAGQRVIRFADLHTGPEQPHVETVLRPGELITGFAVPAGPWARRSLYLKIRDRESYEFALASAAVALDLRDGVVEEARVGLGGVAYRPWRAREAEAALKGRRLDEASAAAAARVAFAGATTHGENAYKVELGQRTLARALLQAAQLEI